MFCPHRGVLVVFDRGAPITIISESEERARHTADVVSLKWRGRPFHRHRIAAAAAVPGSLETCPGREKVQ
jgi:hypothetical protein